MARRKISYSNANSDGTIKSTHSSGSSSNSSSGSTTRSLSSYTGGTSGSGSSSVPYGTYTSGDKYAGGNVFKDSNGKYYQASGSITSASGKTSDIDSNGNINSYYSSGKSKSTGSTYAERAYKDMLEAQEEARSSALSSGKSSLKSDAADASRQAYIQYMQSKKALPGQLSAAGLTGGASESSLLGLESSYGTNLSDIASAKNRGLAELEAQYENGVASDTAAAQLRLAQLAEQQEQEQVAKENQLAALASKSLTQLVAFWKARGYTNAQIASMINQYQSDPENAYAGLTL